MAGEDAVYEAAFERAGIARVFEIGDIFDCAELVARHQPPRGARLAIVTNAGGPGVMATDALIARKGRLATLSPATIEQLNEALPPSWSHGNPVDVLGDARPEALREGDRDRARRPRRRRGARDPHAAGDDQSDRRRRRPWASSRRARPSRSSPPGSGGKSMREGIALLNQAGIATYSTPEQAVRAFMTLVAYARNLEMLYETPRDIPVALHPRPAGDPARLRSSCSPRKATSFRESVSKALLDAYGIPVTTPAGRAIRRRGRRRSPPRVGYPVVLKILSPDITHKTDVGGRRARTSSDEAAVRDAFERIVTTGAPRSDPTRASTASPCSGWSDARDGFELILGAKKDPIFGTVIMVGMGGVAAEVFGDRALGLPPLNERLARRMLESLAVVAAAAGLPRPPGVNIDRLIEILMRFSLPRGRLPRDPGARRQSAARHAGGRESPSTPGSSSTARSSRAVRGPTRTWRSARIPRNT